MKGTEVPFPLKDYGGIKGAQAGAGLLFYTPVT